MQDRRVEGLVDGDAQASSEPRVERRRARGLTFALRFTSPPQARGGAEATEGATRRGHTLVLLHGLHDASTTFDLVAARLAGAGYDVIAPDLRGFGASDWCSDDAYYYFPDYVADVAELLRGLEHDGLLGGRVSLVGHSMGGTVAALLAGSRPEAFTAVALLEGIGPPDFDPGFAPERFASWLDGLARTSRAPRPLRGGLDEAVARLGARYPEIARDVLARHARALTREAPEGLVWCADPWHRTTSPIPFRADQFGAFLSRIVSPVLFVSGGEGGFHTADEAERLARIARLETVTLEGAGHMMHWTRPRETADALLAFFERV